MANQPKTAFIIVCWNNEQLLAECLGSIKAQTYTNHTTVMVDNGSTDDSIAVAKKHMPSIKVLETKRNNGFAKGNNVGIREALKDPNVQYVALINTDARLGKDWLKTILDFCELKPNAACLQGTTLNYFDNRIIDSTHLYVSRQGQATQGNYQKVYYEELGPKKVFGVNAAACVITRKFIESQPYRQLFDESMFMYLEDVDLALRSILLGWDNYLVPGARAYHMGSVSSGGRTGFSGYGLYMTFRNNSGMIIKNYPWKLVFRLFLQMPASDRATIRHLARHNHNQAVWKVLAGRLVGLARSPIYIFKRWRMLGKRKIDANYLWALMRKGY